MQHFCINFNEHSDYYDFFDFQSIASHFLTVFENNFVPRNGIVSLFKCSFTIINCQPPPRVGPVDILDGRVWQTDVYKGIYFNDFVKLNLVNNILKRVIINGMTGNSWRFKRFDSVSLLLTVIKKVKLVNNLMLQKLNLFKNMLELMTKTVTLMSTMR